MAVTVQQLRAEFPEFRNTDQGLLAAKIADAEGLLSASAFGDRYDQAVKYQACHLVALSPTGEFARLKPDKEPDGARSMYERRLNELKRSLVGPMVV